MCGSCVPGYSGGTHKPCTSCKSHIDTHNPFVLAICFVLGFFHWIKSTYIDAWIDNQKNEHHDDVAEGADMVAQALGDADIVNIGSIFEGLKAQIMMTIGNCQVLANATAVLKAAVPKGLTTLLKYLKYVDLNLFQTFSAVCIPSLSSYHTRFTISLLFPFTLFGVVWLIMKIQLCRMKPELDIKSRERLKEVFDDCDEDGSGAIERAEIVQLCEELVSEFGIQMNSQRLESAMDDMDEDGSGEVDFEELCSWWHNTQSEQVIRNTAINRAILLLFFLYPSLTNTVFTMFMCRELDQGQTVHEMDYSIDCNSPGHQAYVLFAIVAMVLVPVGIPVFFGFLFYKNRVDLFFDPTQEVSQTEYRSLVRAVVRQTDPAAAELITNDSIDAIFKEIDVSGDCYISFQELREYAIISGAVCPTKVSDAMAESETNSEMEDEGCLTLLWRDLCGKDIVMRKKKNSSEEDEGVPWWKLGADQLEFLISDYRPKYFWFELMEFYKKFLLTGLLIFVEQGSLTQSFVAIFVAFLNFAFFAKVQPYALYRYYPSPLATVS